MAKKPNVTVTVNGLPVEDYVDREFTLEVKEIRVDLIGALKRAVRKHKVSKGGGRGRGNPGTKRGRLLTMEEVQRISREKGIPYAGENR